MRLPRRRKRAPDNDPEAEARRQQRNRSLWSFIFAIFGWYLLRPTNEVLAVVVAVAIGVAVYAYIGYRRATEASREAKRQARLERWAREDMEEQEREA
ncbi:MAG: hypothetical protein M0R73_08010 [Dehalococcoidia bacterium]|nr:hypothetical protein [Dehalococcoidia bacterium]